MNRLKELRKNKNMKQEELGLMLNVQKSAISKYETGRVPLTEDMIAVLIDFFDITSDYLLGFTTVNHKTTPIEEGLTLENVKELQKYAHLLLLKQKYEE